MIILVALVVTVKIWQYFRRWGDSRALNLDYIEKFLELHGVKFEYFEIFKKHDQEGIDNSENLQKPIKTIIIFTPFLLSIQKIFYLATAIAEMDYRVIVFQSRSFLGNISKIIANDKNNKENTIQSILSKITTHFNTHNLIGFDLIVPLLFHSWTSNDNQANNNQANNNQANNNQANNNQANNNQANNNQANNNQANNNQTKTDKLNNLCIGIRPILSKKELNIFSKFPLTYRWFFLLRLKIQGGLKYFSQTSFQIDKSKIYQKIEQKESEGKRIYLLYPDKNLLSKAKIKQFLKNLKVNNENNQDLQWEFIHGGGFSFREQEIIVLSLILKKISE